MSSLFKDTVIKTLKDLDIEYRWVDHAPVFTVAEASKVIEGKAPIKNLLLEEKNHGRKILVIMAGEPRLDTKLIAKELGTKKLQFAKADILKEALGVTPGAVSLLSLLHDGSDGVEVVLDETLVHEKELGFHPNDNTATLFVPGSSLEKIVKHTGHDYAIIKLH